MRKLVAGLVLFALTSACGGGSNSAAPVPTMDLDAPSANLEQEQPAPTTSTVAEAPSTTSTTAPEATTSLAISIEPPTETTAPESMPASVPASVPASNGDDGPSTNQSVNPFTSTDPDLRDCLIAALGQQIYDELATRQPGPEEQQTMGSCMGPGDPATPVGPAVSAPKTEAVQPTYPPHLTGPLLLGDTTAPTGFDDCMIAQIGGERLGELRSKQLPSGNENDLAALCLLRLQVPLELLEGRDQPFDPDGPADPNSSQDQPPETITVTYPSTSYSVASGGTSGFFTTAQNADIALSAVGFNETGGPLRFNRPSGLTTDGTRLVMTDVFNNRVLIWNTAPTHSNQAPDLVLGQPNFTTNEPGTGRNQLNWPLSASTDGTRLAVTDTNNDRILIWTEFPTSNAEPADIILSGGTNANSSKSNIRWPWGVWTNGNKLAVASTESGSVLIWNSFPTYDGQPADLLLTGSGHIGTPRQITSDGNSLIVGDHNATAGGGNQAGTFFWTSFPTTDQQPYDFFMVDPLGEEQTAPWLRGDFTDDDRLLMMGDTLHIWDGLPESPADRPSLSNLGQGNAGGYDFRWGDYSTVAVVGKRVYITTNGSTLVVYDSIPTSPTQAPDFVLGATDLYVDANIENFVMSNPVPVSNGTSLFASSGFDLRLFVWRNLPDESGAVPDVVYHFCGYSNEETASRHQCWDGFAPWDNTIHGESFALAGKTRLLIWTELPLEGNLPAYDFKESVGSVQFEELTGVAMDDRYFYVADKRAGAVYVWAGIPDGTREPVATLAVNQPTRLSSDGTWLAVNSTMGHSAQIFRVDQIATSGAPTTVGGDGTFNLPEGTTVDGGHLFVADTGNSQVHVWQDVADALAGQSADVILGASGSSDTQPEITRNQMFWPAVASFDGDYLWVGERKFSGRLVRFSPTG